MTKNQGGLHPCLSWKCSTASWRATEGNIIPPHRRSMMRATRGESVMLPMPRSSECSAARATCWYWL